MRDLYFIVSIVFITSCSNQSTSYNEYNLNGKVRKIQEITYEGTFNNGKYELGNKAYSFYDQYLFNEKGNLIEYSNRLDDGGVYEIQKYYYNEDNLRTKIISFDDEGEDYINWEQINLIEDGKILGSEIFDENEELASKVNYKYRGGLVSEIDYEVFDEKYGSKRTYKNEYLKGQLIRQTEFDADNKEIMSTAVDRNSNQDIIVKYISYPDDTTTMVYKSIYEYDDNGNWIRQVKLDNEGELDKIIVRNYEYFGKREKIIKGAEIAGIWFVIKTDDNWFDEDDWIVIEERHVFDIGSKEKFGCLELGN